MDLEKEKIPESGIPMFLQRQSTCDAPVERTDDLELNLQSLRGTGLPLPDPVRGQMERRFGYDFSGIRIHTNEIAQDMAHTFNARAFTTGKDIVFGANEYQPQSNHGRSLLAHEMTHVVQQHNRKSIPTIQRRCRNTVFNFSASAIAQQLRQDLSRITYRQHPTSTPVPRFNPNTVIDLLSASNCFRYVARRVEQHYFVTAPRSRNRGQARPRVTPFHIDFHQTPARGSHFRPGHRLGTRTVDLVEVDVTSATLREVLRRTVHEMVHASHKAPGLMGSGGRVKRIVRGRVREEAQTRQLEDEIMDEIAASPAGQAHNITHPTPASGIRPPSGQRARNRWWAARDAEVRASFMSGLPKLTYEESFIVQQMTSGYQVPGVDQVSAALAARNMVATQMINSVRVSNQSYFNYDNTMVNFHRRRAGGARPAGPTTHFGTIYGTSAAQIAQQTSNIFWTWFQTLPPALYTTNQSSNEVTLTPQGRRAMHLFEWLLIAERISREWQQLGVRTPDPQILREHLLFFRDVRVTRGLRGLQTP